MPHTKLVALECRISRGAVPDERAFEVTTSDARAYSGVAPQHYFWDEDGRHLVTDTPKGDDEIRGKIAARVIDRRDSAVLVSIPDGKVVWVSPDALSSRPSEIRFNVPVGS